MTLHLAPPSDGVVMATIDRGKANALDAALVDQLRAAVAAVGGDQALVIAGSGDMFCAGLATAVVAAGGPSAAALLDAMGALLFDILESPRPVVVAADGHGIAAGAMLMLCADYTVVANREARYGFSEVPTGLALPAPVVALVAERTAPAMRLRLAAHGELLDPARAVAAGVADEIAEPGNVERTAVGCARRLAALPAASYAQTKRLVNGIVIGRMRESST